VHPARVGGNDRFIKRSSSSEAGFGTIREHGQQSACSQPEGDLDGTATHAQTMLRKDGEAYLLKPRLMNQVHYAHYRIELLDAKGAQIWFNNSAQADGAPESAREQEGESPFWSNVH